MTVAQSWAEVVAREFEIRESRWEDPLEIAKEVDSGFVPRAHLQHLSHQVRDAVERVEQGQSQQIVVEMPPRMGKSTLLSLHTPLWILRRHPEWKILTASYDGTLMGGWARTVRNTIEDRPDLGIQMARDGGAGTSWQTREGGGIHSTSVRGPLTGRGAKVMLIDDPVKDFADAHSMTMRQGLWDWWLSTAQTRLEAPSLVIVVMTRWHEDDFVGRLLSREYEGDPDTWQEISFPAIAEDHDALGRQAGDPLYSPLLNETRAQALDRWDKLRTGVGSYSWASLYQQRPAPAQGAIFDTGWWRYWTRDPDKAREDGTIVHLDPATDLTGARWVDSWDAAFKATDSSDYVVGQRWARQGPDRYLIAQQRDRMSFTQTIERMRAWAPDRPSAMNPQGHLVHERLIEDAANGPAIIDTLREEIAGIKPVSPKTSKEARARAITPEIESGNVYLPHPSDPGNEWVQDLLSELRNFPHDVHDDQVDALTQALSNLRDVGRGSITVPGRRRTPARSVVRAAQSIRPARTSPVTAPSRRR